MRKWTGLVLLAVLVPAFLTSAQVNPFKKRIQQLKNSPKQQIDLQSEPDAAPGEELTVSEFLLQRKDLKGQVVELEFDRAFDLKQVGEGYSVRVSFESVRGTEGVTIVLPKEGVEFFEPLAERDRGAVRNTVYVQVLGNNMVRGLGTRYSKGKPLGERYRW